MLKNLENKNKNNNNNNNNNSNSNSNKHVVSWLNSSMAESKKSKIPKNKRVFLLTDLTKNFKIKHVWDRRFLNGLVESYETRYNRVRNSNDSSHLHLHGTSLVRMTSRRIHPQATKEIIKQIMNLEASVNTIMKINNRDYLARSNILETIKRGVRRRDITTEKQLKELALIYKVTGKELFISGHKKGGDYYTAYVNGEFKPHHIKFMKQNPLLFHNYMTLLLKVDFQRER